MSRHYPHLIIALALSVLLHELAHAWTGRAVGWPTGRIVLSLLGGLVVAAVGLTRRTADTSRPPSRHSARRVSRWVGACS
mgnify:CR=1 FL=1